MTGNFSTKSLIISNEELPEPTIIPALKVVNAYFFEARASSTFLRDCRCFYSISSLVIPLK